jgi:hypothetical protein
MTLKTLYVYRKALGVTFVGDADVALRALEADLRARGDHGVQAGWAWTADRTSLDLVVRLEAPPAEGDAAWEGWVPAGTVEVRVREPYRETLSPEYRREVAARAADRAEMRRGAK